MTERSGGGEVKVVAFNFYDNGKICSSIKMCSSLNMMLSIFVEKDIEKGAAVGILCRDKMGYDIFSGNLNFYNEFLPALNAGEKIVLDIQLKVSLAPGEYFFGYGIKPHPLSGYFYDRGFNAAKILIEQPSEIKYAVGGCVFAELKQFEIYRG